MSAGEKNEHEDGIHGLGGEAALNATPAPRRGAERASAAGSSPGAARLRRLAAMGGSGGHDAGMLARLAQG